MRGEADRWPRSARAGSTRRSRGTRNPAAASPGRTISSRSGPPLVRDRLVPGWAALEASWRIDPDQAAARRALAGLERKLNLAVGRDQAARREAADEVEFLRPSAAGRRWACS